MPSETSQFHKGTKKKSPGRPIGSENGAKKEVREVCKKLLSDKVYQANLLVRLRAGEAGSIENTMWYYAYGKPQAEMNVNLDLSRLSDEEVTLLERIAAKIPQT